MATPSKDGQNIVDMIGKNFDPAKDRESMAKSMQPGKGDNLLDDVEPVDPPDWLVGPGCPH